MKHRPANNLAENLGFEKRGGGFAIGAALFLASAACIRIIMRPDPLVVSGGVDLNATVKKRTVPFREAVAIAWARFSRRDRR